MAEDIDSLVLKHEPDSPSTPEAAEVPPAPPEPPALRFSGSGAEYFRIWVVNLLLTVATLGIYSAWAKTRRLQYFYRNTQLAGASFDFRGNPKAILRGRLLAAAVAAVYHYAFGFSATAGMVTVLLLAAGLPFMMRAALRFRLANTYYRGLSFGFAGSVQGAYRVYLLPVAMFVLPGGLLALMPGNPKVGLVFLVYLLWPLMHGAMKRYQHANLVYGDQRASFTLGIGRLAMPYLRAILAGLGVTLVSGFAVFGIGAALRATPASGIVALLPIITVVLGYLFILLSGPFIMVRMNNLAWSDTRFPGVRIVSALKARSYLRLQVVNVLLTLLTLGLFRPFAAVRTWRYRVEHTRIDALEGFEGAASLASRRPAAAAGDGVADFLGVDLSW